MELYKEIMVKVLEKKTAMVEFPGLQIEAEKIVEQECYRALLRIKNIIEDERLEDEDCFWKIEEIIRTLEAFGSDGGFRHD